MVQKSDEKMRAIKLRREGYSYNEILKQILVAKSTLSLWLRSVELSKRQYVRLTEKKRQSALRGAHAKKTKRVNLETIYKQEGATEIGNLSIRDLFVIGVALYWAEGSKIKSYNPSVVVRFSNSDPMMIKTFIAWCTRCQKLSLNQLRFNIYIHISHQNRIEEIKRYWSGITGINSSEFDKIYYKRHNPNPTRKRVGDLYNGQLTIIVKKSVNLNRKISGYIEEISKQCGVV